MWSRPKSVSPKILWQAMIEPSLIEIHRTLARIFAGTVSEMTSFSRDFWWKIMILENSWNHHRIIPRSFLGAPRSSLRLVDLSKLLKSPRISNHDRKRFNVTSDPLITYFPQFPCAGAPWTEMRIPKHHPSHYLGQGWPNMVRSTLLHSRVAKTRVPDNHSYTGHFERPLSWVIQMCPRPKSVNPKIQ